MSTRGPGLHGARIRAWRDRSGLSAERLADEIGRWLAARAAGPRDVEATPRWRRYGLKDDSFSARLVYKIESEGTASRAYARAFVDFLKDRHGVPEALLYASTDGIAALSTRARDELLGAAMRLDRSVQWLALRAACDARESVYLLLHGSYRQALSLFLRRAEQVLSQQMNVVSLPYASQGIVPTSGTEWEVRLGESMATARLGGAAKGALLRPVTATTPLLILLEMPWNEPFAPEHAAGLRSFLVEVLPRLVGEAPPSSFGVRLLVAADYHERRLSREEALARLMREAQAASPLVRFHSLPEVSLPSLAEVEEYLRAYRLEPGDAIYRRIIADYELVLRAEDSAASFRDICHDLFDRRLLALEE